LRRWSQLTLLTIAAAMLTWCVLVVADAWMFQRGESRRFDRLLADTPRTASPIALRSLPPVVDGGTIGRLEIGRLALSVIVIEGTSATALRRAVGHIAGTALPGERGNVGVSGHRDTFFRPLRNIRKDDIITITTLLGEYRYRVVSTKIVGPSDVGVLEPGEGEFLTLVTCYPFYFVGSAPDRFIVRAERVI
jgi:sortase A